MLSANRGRVKAVSCSVAGLGEDRNALGAFLFTWPSGFDDPGTPAVKLPKARGRPVHGLTLQCPAPHEDAQVTSVANGEHCRAGNAGRDLTQLALSCEPGQPTAICIHARHCHDSFHT